MTNFDIIRKLTDDEAISEILTGALSGESLDVKDGVALLESSNLNLIGAAADELRKKSAGELVTFVVDRNINYTNVCSSKCRFCAFYREADAEDAYVLTVEEITAKVEEAVKLGATQILLQGGLNPDLTIDYYEDMLRQIKTRFNVQMHAFSPPEITHISNLYGAGIKETISRLRDAGLDSIPGGGAEILDDRVRSTVSPNKIGWKKWEEVMLEAHALGVPTTATMVFGHAESIEERVKHIIRIREIQKKFGGFTAFIPWSFQSIVTSLPKLRFGDWRPRIAKRYVLYGSRGTQSHASGGRIRIWLRHMRMRSREPAGFRSREPLGFGMENTQLNYASTGMDYLKMVALSRLLLNRYIKNIQASWVTQGLSVAQVALNFGANDLGGTMIEENVVRAAGVPFQSKSVEEFVYAAKRMGRPVAKRDTLYNIIERY